MRIDKFLADCGYDVRSKCKDAVKKGRVIVNGELIKDPGFHVSDTDEIVVDGELLKAIGQLYYVFHKPKGCICATRDANHKTVLEYFPENLRDKLLIVGRLDKDTEGMLLLTNDGAFLHRLMSPKKHVNKTYYFEAEGRLFEDAAARVAQGIDIGDDKPTKPGLLIIDSYDDKKGQIKGKLTISEGRYHQVKRMVKALGAEVTYLKRVSIGALALDASLQSGEFRELSKDEIESLQA